MPSKNGQRKPGFKSIRGTTSAEAKRAQRVKFFENARSVPKKYTSSEQYRSIPEQTSYFDAMSSPAKPLDNMSIPGRKSYLDYVIENNKKNTNYTTVPAPQTSPKPKTKQSSKTSTKDTSTTNAYEAEYRKRASDAINRVLGLAKDTYDASIRGLDPKYTQYRTEGETEMEKARQAESNRVRAEYMARGIGDSEQAVQGLGAVDAGWRDKLTNFINKLTTEKANEATGLLNDYNQAKSGAYTNQAQLEAKLMELGDARKQQQFENDLALKKLYATDTLSPTQRSNQQSKYLTTLENMLKVEARAGEGNRGRERVSDAMKRMFEGTDITPTKIDADIFGSATDPVTGETIYGLGWGSDGWEKAYNAKYPQNNSMSSIVDQAIKDALEKALRSNQSDQSSY